MLQCLAGKNVYNEKLFSMGLKKESWKHFYWSSILVQLWFFFFFFFTRLKLHQWCFSNLILKIILCFSYILLRYRKDTTLCHNSTKEYFLGAGSKSMEAHEHLVGDFQRSEVKPLICVWVPVVIVLNHLSNLELIWDFVLQLRWIWKYYCNPCMPLLLAPIDILHVKNI